MQSHTLETTSLEIDQLENSIKTSEHLLDQVARDEYNAKREHILHKDLAGFVRRMVMFDENGAHLKSGSQDSYILTITAIDLPKVNTEMGKKAGDNYLKKTVEIAQDILGENVKASEIFHRGSQDFTVLVTDTNSPLASQMIQEKNIVMGETELHNSVAYIKMEDVVKVYNEFADLYELKDNSPNLETMRTKIFSELLLKMSEYHREFKKLHELADEYIANPDHLTKEQVERFNKYVSYAFMDTDFFKLEGFKPEHDDSASKRYLMAKYNHACHAIAARNTFAERKTFKTYWNILIEDYAQQFSVEHLKYIPPAVHEVTESTKSFVEFRSEHRTTNRARLEFSRNGLDKMDEEVKLALVEFDKLMNRDNSDVHEITRHLRSYYTWLDNFAEQGYLQNNLLNLTKEFFPQLESQDVKGFETYLTSASAQEHLQVLEKLTKIKLAIELEKNNMNIELCSVDFMTGLKNKDVFENRLNDIHLNPDENYHIISLDLGFLKYFNKEGDREIGDTAIMTAGCVLQNLEDMSDNLEVFRTGGDEFSILCRGNKKNVQRTIQQLAELAEAVGPIPTNGKTLGHYEPEQLQFNVGYSLKEEAVKTLQYLADPKLQAISVEDTKRLNPNFPDFDVRFFAETLAKVQNMVAAAEIDNQKLFSRVSFLVDLYKQGKIDHFYTLYPYSGKALEGLGIEIFESIVKENLQDGTEAIVQDIKQALDANLGLDYKRESTLDNVVKNFVYGRVSV
jgi:GGDEF domain-containing protein